MEIQRGISLKALNTFGIDARAAFFCEITTEDELKEILKNYEFRYLPKLILGGGSNILFTKDFEGIVIKVCNKGIEIVEESEDSVTVKVAAGETWPDFVNYCILKNWGGIENLSLIPGCVGASPIQNIGAYGVEMKDTFVELEAFDLSCPRTKTIKKEECKLGYRDSIFKREFRNKFVILSVTFKLSKKPVPNISYGSLEKELKALGIAKPSIKQIGDTVSKIRQSKLPDPAEYGNAGSFFKNPVIAPEVFKKIKLKHPAISHFKQEDKNIKLAAAWLIEECGWKGYASGNYGVHEDQSLILVNFGGAKGKEIQKLSELIKRSVFSKFGVELETEVNII